MSADKTRSQQQTIWGTMKGFVAGFCFATIIWIGILMVEPSGVVSLFGGEVAPEPEETASAEIPVLEEKDAKRVKKRRGRRRGKNRQSGMNEGLGYEVGNGSSGDSLGNPGSGELEMGGSMKEDQLTESQIDKGIDRVFSGIERCLVLVPAQAPTAGKVVVGMRITSSGRVTKASLKGPKALVDGDAGSCIRRNVKSIKYPSFDGPDMVVNYPITFE